MKYGAVSSTGMIGRKRNFIAVLIPLRAVLLYFLVDLITFVLDVVNFSRRVLYASEDMYYLFAFGFVLSFKASGLFFFCCSILPPPNLKKIGRFKLLFLQKYDVLPEECPLIFF